MMTEKSKNPASKLRMSRAQIKQALEEIPVEQRLGIVGKKSSLTTKEREFARLVAEGETKAGAYRKAYNSKGKAKTAGDNGYKLAKKDGIKQEIEAFRVAMEAMEYQKTGQMKAFILHQLTLHALNEENPANARIKSLELLGKSADVGLFVERKETVVHHTSENAKAKLVKQLQDALKRNSIEVDYRESGESLLAELAGVSGDENAQEQTHLPATHLTDGIVHQTTTHSIPHTQTPQIENTPLQAIDLQEEKNQSVNVYTPPPSEINQEKGNDE